MLSNSSICSEAVVFSHFINSYLSVDFEAGLLQRVLKVQNLKRYMVSNVLIISPKKLHSPNKG